MCLLIVLHNLLKLFWLSLQWRPILNTSLEAGMKPQPSWTGPVSFRSETTLMCDHRPWREAMGWGLGGQEWVLGMDWDKRKIMKKKKKTEGLQSMYCAENNGTQGPLLGWNVGELRPKGRWCHHYCAYQLCAIHYHANRCPSPQPYGSFPLQQPLPSLPGILSCEWFILPVI